MNSKPILLAAALCTALVTQVLAQDGAGEAAADADAVARELANPNNSLASLVFKNQYYWYEGDLPGADDEGNYLLLFQPVFPFTMKETASGGKANLFVRPALPLLVDQPLFNAAKGEFENKTALGDIVFDVGYGVTEKSGLLWATGVVGTLPTATHSALAGKQFRLGPELLLAKFNSWGIYGIFPNHQWDVTGWGNGGYFSTSSVQLFLVFLPGGGWNIGTKPTLSYNWKSNQWTVPLNFGASKTVIAGSTPIKLNFEVNYYVEKPDPFGPEWMISFDVTPVVPNFIANMFNK